MVAMRSLVVVLLVFSLSGCATTKAVLRTVDDIANAACLLFGEEHPEEFKQLAMSRLPPGSVLDDAQKSGFDPRMLCDVKEVLQPFIDQQIRMQSSMRAGIHAETSGGADTE